MRSIIVIGLSTFVSLLFFFFFNDTATTEIYTLSLHDALPISRPAGPRWPGRLRPGPGTARGVRPGTSRTGRARPSRTGGAVRPAGGWDRFRVAAAVTWSG